MLVTSRSKESFKAFLQSTHYKNEVKPSLESQEWQNIMKNALQVWAQILEIKRQSDIVLWEYANIPCAV